MKHFQNIQYSFNILKKILDVFLINASLINFANVSAGFNNSATF